MIQYRHPVYIRGCTRSRTRWKCWHRRGNSRRCPPNIHWHLREPRRSEVVKNKEQCLWKVICSEAILLWATILRSLSSNVSRTMQSAQTCYHCRKGSIVIIASKYLETTLRSCKYLGIGQMIWLGNLAFATGLYPGA